MVFLRATSRLLSTWLAVGLALGPVVAAGIGCRGRPALDAGKAATVTVGGTRVQLGEREILLPRGGLGLEFFPDENVIALSRRPLRLLLTARDSTYLVEGPGLRSLDRATRVLEPGGPGAFDNGYAGIGGVHRHGDGRIYAFYHAEDQEGMPRGRGGWPGFDARVGLAVSDDGRRWEKLGAVLSGAQPKHHRTYADQAANGTGIPSAVLDRGGEHLLLYYNEFSQVDRRGVQVFVARAALDAPPAPGRFRKYHGGVFQEPGLGGRETPVLSARSLDESHALFPNVVFSAHLDRYVMVLCVDHWKRRLELQGGGRALERPPVGHESGTAVAFSRDGIQWDGPYRLFADWCMPRLGGRVSWEPSLVFDDEIGRTGWLLYGYSESWGPRSPITSPHHLAGRRIAFGP